MNRKYIFIYIFYEPGHSDMIYFIQSNAFIIYYECTSFWATFTIAYLEAPIYYADNLNVNNKN